MVCVSTRCVARESHRIVHRTLHSVISVAGIRVALSMRVIRIGFGFRNSRERSWFANPHSAGLDSPRGSGRRASRCPPRLAPASTRRCSCQSSHLVQGRWTVPLSRDCSSSSTLYLAACSHRAPRARWPSPLRDARGRKLGWDVWRLRRPLHSAGLDRAGACARHKRGDTPTNVGSYMGK
jgi:hypothetical protein